MSARPRLPPAPRPWSRHTPLLLVKVSFPSCTWERKIPPKLRLGSSRSRPPCPPSSRDTGPPVPVPAHPRPNPAFLRIYHELPSPTPRFPAAIPRHTPGTPSAQFPPSLSYLSCPPEISPLLPPFFSKKTPKNTQKLLKNTQKTKKPGVASRPPGLFHPIFSSGHLQLRPATSPPPPCPCLWSWCRTSGTGHRSLFRPR